jgi:hypothetical protein
LGRTGKRTLTQPGRCSWTKNTSGTLGIEGSSLTCQEEPNVMVGCVDDGSSKMPARGALTCAVNVTPGGNVVTVGGEVVGGDVLGGTDVVPEVRGDPLPPPHATRSRAMRAGTTSRTRQRGNARRSAPECCSAGWINDVTLRRRHKRTPGAEAPGVLFVVRA